MALYQLHSVETVIHVLLLQPPLISCNVAFISLVRRTISNPVSLPSILLAVLFFPPHPPLMFAPFLSLRHVCLLYAGFFY